MSKSLQNYISEVPDRPLVKKPAAKKVVETVVENNESKTASLKDYIKTVASEKKSEPIVNKPVVQEAPVLKIVEHIAEQPATEVELEPVVEQVIIKEDTTQQLLIENLQETVSALKNIIVEQQQSQAVLSEVMTSLLESIQYQNELTEKRFENVDLAISQTTSILQETAEKLQLLSIREVNIPAPVVNVSLSEQKRVTKTVDRDANGLITKITEDTEQSVTQDK
jgi:hypothetical protein